jgi:hypothetical protein
MSTADFASYNAIVFGDPFCAYADETILATPDATKQTWTPAVTGNVVLIGTDVSYHFGTGQSSRLIRDGLSWAAKGSGTGMYVSLSCYYAYSDVGTTVNFLSELGAFTVQGQYAPPFTGCPDVIGLTPEGFDHPALRGITASGLSFWSCAIHEAFDSFPSTFRALAQDKDFHIPYIIATAPRG